MKKILILLITFMYLSTELMAQVEVVSTTTLPNGWVPANVRTDSSVIIDSTQSRAGQVSALGDSSIKFNTNFVTSGQDKADYQFIWQTSLGAIDFPTRTLNNLTQLSYDYYRDSTSAVNANLHPALRLIWVHDSNTPTNPSDDTFGSFIYEAAYQPGFSGTVLTNTWINENVLSSEFWLFCSDCDPSASVASGAIHNYDLTLTDWLSGPQTGIVGDPAPPDFSTGLLYIVGINTGVGSGWNNNSLMYADNIRFAFGANDDFVFNFEDDDSTLVLPAAVPVPIMNSYSIIISTAFLLLLLTLMRVKNS